MKMKMMKMKMIKMKVKVSMMMMKEISDDDSYRVMKVILWWKLSSDESHDSEKSDDLWRFACGDVCTLKRSFYVNFMLPII